jgi:hypothetical protein
VGMGELDGCGMYLVPVGGEAAGKVEMTRVTNELEPEGGVEYEVDVSLAGLDEAFPGREFRYDARASEAGDRAQRRKCTEGGVGGRPPEPPLRPARWPIRTCTRPHMCPLIPPAAGEVAVRTCGPPC